MNTKRQYNKNSKGLKGLKEEALSLILKQTYKVQESDSALGNKGHTHNDLKQKFKDTSIHEDVHMFCSGQVQPDTFLKQ